MAKIDLDQALAHIAAETLAPIVRRLLTAKIPFACLEGRLRELFVEIAEADFRMPGRPQTDSQIALLTGINRKEVRRLRARSTRSMGPSSLLSRNQMASLISRWTNNPELTDGAEKPRPIPYQAKRGLSFVRLARAVKASLPPRAVLDELLRLGVVKLSADNRISLETDSYVPTTGQPERLAMLAEDPAELMETMLRNIFSDGEERLLQRKVSYDNLGTESIERIRLELRREGERFLRRVNKLLGKYDRDRNPNAPSGERLCAGMGAYYFERPYAVPVRQTARRRPAVLRPRKERTR